MKKENGVKIQVYPERDECFQLIIPANLQIGDIFCTEGISSLADRDGKIHQLLRKVTKIELLQLHENHLVISSILVGATVSKTSHKNVVLNNRKTVVIKYYNEDHVKKKNCNFKNVEKPELFSKTSEGNCHYYLVDVSKLDSVKVPPEENSDYLGYFI